MLSPLQFHYGDPIWLLYASWVVGSPLIAMRRFSVSRFWTVARDHGATHVCTIGAIPNLLLTAEPTPADRDHGVRFALAVGIPASRHRELVDRFGVRWLEIYGSSEAGTIMAMPEQCADAYVGTGAIGIPVPGVIVRLVDEHGEVVAGLPAKGRPRSAARSSSTATSATRVRRPRCPTASGSAPATCCGATRTACTTSSAVARR